MLEKLINNIDKIHTPKLGIERIKNNLKINTNNVVEYCKEKIKKSKITINSYSFTIITAHIKEEKHGI